MLKQAEATQHYIASQCLSRQTLCGSGCEMGEETQAGKYDFTTLMSGKRDMARHG